MDPTLRLILAVIALVLAVIDIIRSDARALTSWAVAILAVIHIWSDWDAAFD